jgi:hypothetical protein
VRCTGINDKVEIDLALDNHWQDTDTVVQRP